MSALRPLARLARPSTRAFATTPTARDWYVPTPLVHESVGGGWHTCALSPILGRGAPR